MKCMPYLFGAATLALAVAHASAHETLYEVKSGKALALRAYFADGEALAYAAYEIFSPNDTKIPYQKGRTDRAGWVAFVPNAVGKWRVRILDETGHGLDLEVDSDLVKIPDSNPGSHIALTNLAFVLRPIIGILIIGTIFTALLIIYRRKERTK